MVPPFVLTTLIALYQALFGLHALDLAEHAASRPEQVHA
jgi:hypothetical protein